MTFPLLDHRDASWPQLADIDEELLTPPGMAAIRKLLIVDSESLERNG
jgi:hypothetical protein